MKKFILFIFLCFSTSIWAWTSEFGDCVIHINDKQGNGWNGCKDLKCCREKYAPSPQTGNRPGDRYVPSQTGNQPVNRYDVPLQRGYLPLSACTRDCETKYAECMHTSKRADKEDYCNRIYGDRGNNNSTCKRLCVCKDFPSYPGCKN